jgi:hypothetical protein
VATGALELVAPVDRAVAGGVPPFAPEQIAAALCRRLGAHPTPRQRARIGRLLRWSYGPGWAIVYALARERLPRGRWVRAALLGGAIFGFETAALPLLVGRRLFRPRVAGALVLHVALFAATVELVLSALLPPRRHRRAAARRWRADRAPSSGPPA